MLKIELPGMSKSGISQKRFMEVMKEDMQRVSVTEGKDLLW